MTQEHVVHSLGDCQSTLDRIAVLDPTKQEEIAQAPAASIDAAVTYPAIGVQSLHHTVGQHQTQAVDVVKPSFVGESATNTVEFHAAAQNEGFRIDSSVPPAVNVRNNSGQMGHFDAHESCSDSIRYSIRAPYTAISPNIVEIRRMFCGQPFEYDRVCDVCRRGRLAISDFEEVLAWLSRRDPVFMAALEERG